jgi:hypothetical protein
MKWINDFFKTFEFKQWHLNVGLVLVLVLASLLIFPAMFGLDSFSFAGNLLTYLFFAGVVGFLLPGLIGFALRFWPIQKVDDKFGKSNENLPDAVHVLICVVFGAVTGWLWKDLMIPLISKVYSLSIWANEFFRFRGDYSDNPSGEWFFVSLVVFAIGYFVGHVTILERLRRSRY